MIFSIYHSIDLCSVQITYYLSLNISFFNIVLTLPFLDTTMITCENTVIIKLLKNCKSWKIYIFHPNSKHFCLCEEKFSSLRRLRDHNYNYHKKLSDPVECSQCGMQFNTKGDLKQHLVQGTQIYLICF